MSFTNEENESKIEKTSSDNNTRKRIVINRPIYTQAQFENEFTNTNKQKIKKNSLIRKLNPRKILNIFTILNLITEYNFKKLLVPDILSGLTVGIMHIPAALAYGALTSLNPVNGLYTSFYTGLTYVLFGTSKHLSVGTFAITSLMVYSTINRVESEYSDSSLAGTQENLNFTSDLNDSVVLVEPDFQAMQFKIKIATSLAFWCGIFQILFCIFRLGNISKYLSQPLLRGFTTAAAFHVFTTQIRHILGIYYVHKKRRRVFKLIFNYFRLFQHIFQINWAAFIFSVICITFLVLARTQINERFKKQLRNVPLPIELFVIITGTLVSYFGKLNSRFNLAIVGKIPEGLAEPSLPEFSMFLDVYQDAIIISIIAFATSISVSDLYARKYKYKIDSNKEFFALGMANVVGSFFQCFVSCGALARTAVLESSGGKSQLVTIIASMVVMTVMMWFSHLLQTLPKACLGSIIIAALINLLKQVKDIPHYWKLDKLDFFVWIITFLSSIILDIDFGLCIGILAVLFINTYRSRNMSIKVLGKIKDYEIHSDLKLFTGQEYESVKVLRPNKSIFYINSDLFRSELNSICPLDSSNEKNMCQNCQTNYGCLLCSSKSNRNESNLDINLTEMDQTLVKKVLKKKIIVLDFSDVQFIDEAGVKCLRECLKDYAKENVKILFSNCNQSVLVYFKKMNFKYEDIVFLSIQDAIQSLDSN